MSLIAKPIANIGIIYDWLCNISPEAAAAAAIPATELPAVLHRPDEGSHSQSRRSLVFLAHSLEYRIDLFIGDKSQDGIVESRPCVTSFVRFSVHAPASGHLVPEGVAAAFVLFEKLDQLPVVGLVI